MRFGEVKFETNKQYYIFEVEVYLNDIEPNAIRVELYADGLNGSNPVRLEMKCISNLASSDSGYVYSALAPLTRSALDYTARVIPNYENVAVPLEVSQILWQR
jgi:starch phosphorylase